MEKVYNINTMLKKSIALICFVISCTVYSPDLLLQQQSTTITQIPEAWKDEPVIALNDSINIILSSIGSKNSIRYENITYFYVNNRNPTILETMSFTQYVALESTPVINATVLYPDGSLWKAGVTDFNIFQYHQGPFYKSDDLIYTFTIPRYVKGLIIRLQIIRTINSPEHFWHEFVRDKFNVLKKNICFTYPKNYAITYLICNNENLPIDTVVNENSTNRSIILTAGNLLKFQESNRLKKPELWYAGLHISVPSIGTRSYSWQELGDCYLKSIDHTTVSSPKIKEFAADIRSTERDSIIAQTFKKLQHAIRYFANFEDYHSYIPRPAAETMAKGYGDCKDMAVLLKTILKEKNITVDLALISTEGMVQCHESVPTLGNFNHAIVFYRKPDNSLQFHDPTNPYGNPDNSYYNLVGQKALLLEMGRNSLTVVEKGANYTSVITTRSKICQKPGVDNWQLEGTISMKGKAAFKLFPFLQEKKGEEVRPFLADFLDELFNLKVNDAKIGNITSDYVELSFTMNFQGSYLVMDKGGFHLNAPSLFGGDPRYTTLDYEGPRFFDDCEQFDEWELPAGFNDLEKTDLDHPIACGTWTKKNNTVYRSFSMNAIDIPYDRRGEAQQFLDNKKKFTKATIWK